MPLKANPFPGFTGMLSVSEDVWQTFLHDASLARSGLRTLMQTEDIRTLFGLLQPSNVDPEFLYIVFFIPFSEDRTKDQMYELHLLDLNTKLETLYHTLASSRIFYAITDDVMRRLKEAQEKQKVSAPS